MEILEYHLILSMIKHHRLLPSIKSNDIPLQTKVDVEIEHGINKYADGAAKVWKKTYES